MSILLILHDRVVVIRSSLVQSVNFVEVVAHICRESRKKKNKTCQTFTVFKFKPAEEREEPAVLFPEMLIIL